jgi:RecB family exonuclease
LASAAAAEPAAGEPGAFDPAALAAARLAVLDEVDPDLTTPEGRRTRRRLGPYLGFIGALDAAPGADPRRSALYVTALERMAACPWQVFLERLLRLEPTPDPVQSLPDVNALLLGNAVHKVLETLVEDALGDGAPKTLEEAGARGVSPAAWPPADELKSRLRDVAEALVVEEGIALAGMARVLERRAIHCLAEAAATDWRAGSVPAIGAEVVGAIEVADAAGRPRRLAFKADRADARARGLVLTDYKTGRPISTAKTDTYRRRHLLAEIAAGRKLQAAAYALAEGAAAGRYLFLKPGLAADAREFQVTAADREAAAAFAAAARAALAAWDAGSFFPRVVLPDENKEPPTCRWCAVAEACVRGDSGARLRLFEWANRQAGDDDGDGAEPDAATTAERSGAEEALLSVWELARRPERPGKRR